MKKGVSYVDVAISAGIFIIYLLFIFVTLKPGIKEDIKGDYLLQIVSSNLNEKISMNLSKYPFFINYSEMDPGGWDPTNGGDVIVELKGFPFNWSENKTLMLDKNYRNNYANMNFNITKHDTNTMNLTFIANSNNLRFNPPLTDHDVFFLIHSEDFNLSADFSQPSATQTPRILSKDNFGFRFGTKETIFGIGEEKLLNTKNNYQQLKQEFNFPFDKEFSFTVYEGKNPNSIIYSYSEVIPTETEKNIFVLQWSDILIKKNGETIPIIINIRTW